MRDENGVPVLRGSPKDRIFFLDILKAISITTVVFFHASSNLTESTKYQLDILLSPFRFCVPVLLTISLFLLNRSLEMSYEQQNLLVFRKRLIRLLFPISFWFSVASVLTLFFNFIYDKELHLKDVVFLNLQGQIFWGGYFLIILLQCLPIIIFFKDYLNLSNNICKGGLFQCAIFTFCYILFYKEFSIKIIEILCTLSRPVFFYWVVYILLGGFFWKKLPLLVEKSQELSLSVKLILIIVTSSMMIIENAYVHSFIHNNCFYSNFEYIRFSYILSVIIMFLCFASIKEDSLLLFCRRMVYIFSKYSLGVFCINGIISKFFLPNIIQHLIKTPITDLRTALIIKIIVWPLLLLLSLGLSLILSKIGLRRCVS